MSGSLSLAPLIDRVRAATASGTPLRICGGGTKGFLAPTPPGDALDTRPYSGITSYEPSELVVTARAGTPLAELEAVLADKGQCLPFEPPRFARGGTVGGMVAAGLSGPSRASVGSVRDHVLGLSMVNGRAEHLTFGGQVMKNVAGYDVSRLMVGAHGTLGLITEVSLKVLPLAATEATLRFELSQAQALQQLNRWGGQPLPLNASCWVRDEGVDTLYLRLRGAAAAVEAACRTLGGERQDVVAAAADWALCRDQQLPWFQACRQADAGLDLWRLSVPQTAPVLNLPEAPLVEWHGGLRWVRALPDQAQHVAETARAVDGSATLFIANNTEDTRARHLFGGQKWPLQKVHHALKQQFDPAHVFNRGRLAQNL